MKIFTYASIFGRLECHYKGHHIKIYQGDAEHATGLNWNIKGWLIGHAFENPHFVLHDSEKLTALDVFPIACERLGIDPTEGIKILTPLVRGYELEEESK